MTSQAARFLIVGLVCALTHILVVVGADRAGLHYAIGCVISFLAVVALGFVLHARFTFAEPPTAEAFARYAAGMAANYPLTLLLLFLLVDGAGITVAVATVASTVVLTGWNFLASRWALVRRAAPAADVSPLAAPRRGP